ncbi:MAG: ATP-dependent protease [Gammaproteobacteria bacterium]|nr:MAG: ATP-dependent protease [Gammaproteobacteria bacterium]
MTLAIVYSRASAGITAPLVTVEVHLSNGMAGLNIVGLPEAAVKESKDRVRSALMNTQFEFPCRRITINLAPADLPKEGGRFDLPIALGILAASDQLPHEVLKQYEFAGELALSGELRPIRGVLPVVLSAYQSGRRLIVPHHNAQEAALVQQAQTLSAKHLLEVCAHLRGEQSLVSCSASSPLTSHESLIDLADVKGQPHAKRALEIAAAGRHSLLFIGPPGTGKTMLASRLPSILPEINDQEALEVAAIASVSNNGFDAATWKRIPFRSPHHSSSSVALVGGGRPPRPGEISLAHHGVLFLDEFPEFSRHVLESLREPLESGSITISRAAFQTSFPAQFQLMAAMNPCPCGYAGSAMDHCRCSKEQIQRYLGKISGPLLDRIDMQVEVARLPPNLLANINQQAIEHSDSVRARVIKARDYQYQRQGKCNNLLSVPEIDQFFSIQPEAIQLLNHVMTRFNLSARVYHRIIKVARTIADLDGSQAICQAHLSEALQYRCLDRLKKEI